MMQLVVTNLWTGKAVVDLSLNTNLSDKSINKAIAKYLRNLPKGYMRNKRKRKYCHQVDMKLQKTLGLNKFYLSMYVGKFYKVEAK